MIREIAISARLIGALWASVAIAQAETYYLAADGDDASGGGKDDPWSSLSAAASRLQPGDTLFLREGVYRIDAPERIAAKGDKDGWITIAGHPGETVVFDGADYVPARGEHELGLIDVNGSSYLRLKNLEVRNSHGMGFHIVHPSHDIEIMGCRSDNTYGPGIGVWGIPKELKTIERVRVIGNEVTRANMVSMEIYPGPHEPPHEAISMAGVHDFEVARNHVHHCGKEGIDVKEYSARGRVHHNHVHDVARQGLYVDAWFGDLHDITFDHNLVHDNEWGIGVSCEGPNSTLQDIYIHNNQFYGHRASGIYFTLWGGDRFRERIYVYNNTFVDNGSLDHWSGPTGNIDLRSSNVGDIYVFNNIASGGAAFELASFIPPQLWAETATEKKIVFERNLVTRHIDKTQAASYPTGYGRNFVAIGERTIVADPKLRLEGGVYRLSSDSPARGVGLARAPDGAALPGISSDVGAQLHAVPASGPGWQSASRPNVVILLADDLGFRDVGSYGGPVETPAIDRLAAGGIRFTDFYSGSAVCSPSRATLMTGRHHIRAGVYSWIHDQTQKSHLLEREVTLAEILKEAGYDTGHFGKWHLGLPSAARDKPTPADHGLDYWFATANNANPSHRNPTNFVRNGEELGELEGYSCQIVVNEALQWLDARQASEQPFFLNVWFHEPHAPLAAPEELALKYGDSDDKSAVYSATIENTDRAVGRLLEALRENGALENTLILYASDNGSYLNERTGGLRGVKGSNWEGGLRVPGIFYWPGRIEAGQVESTPAGLVDVLPTICGILEIDTPSGRHLDGADLTPLLLGNRAAFEREQALYWHLHKSRPIVAMRKGRYNLVADPDYELPRDNLFQEAWIPIIREGGYTNFRLYDLVDDPSQQRELSGELPEVFERLKQELMSINNSVMNDGYSWHEE